MRRFILLICGIFVAIRTIGATAPLAKGDSAAFVVESCQKWNASAIILKNHYAYRFDVISINNLADGPIVLHDLNGWERWYTAPLFVLRRVPFERWFTLIGTTDQRAPFRIRDHQAITMRSDGELKCFFNDTLLRYSNNKGSAKLRVTCLGPSGPAPLPGPPSKQRYPSSSEYGL